MISGPYQLETIVLLLIGVLALLTIVLAVSEGISARVVVSLLILALFGFGVVGALREGGDE